MLKLIGSIDNFMTISSDDNTPEQFNGYIDNLETVFENGESKKEQSFEEIRNISNKFLDYVNN